MKKVLLICGCIVLALAAVFGGIYFGTPGGKIISTSASIIGFNSVEELNSKASLIIIGSPEEDFLSCKPIIEYNDSGRYGQFYTMRKLKVDRVLKGDKKYESIEVVETAAAINNDPLKYQKDIMTIEDYRVMEKGKKYILFLDKNEAGQNYIVGVYQGKFNLDGQDTVEKNAVEENRHYRNLKRQALEEYEADISAEVSVTE
ncbi:hypothetical protein DFR58_11695 [Anaerobacterium chartisolvens]|uniref:Uncharacterized protein n=1 Tax=Anaerobacterium chartisolvens TaxID=1297424 RepID=A0A369AX42_9FIRM|nr:hypothetical protein [Anaerobacterium chartisolvens]RCX13859.1 hypothetical protein DFR58_11695 [Anaerobacterium chartisolvens]